MHTLLLETIAFVGATVHTMAPSDDPSLRVVPAAVATVIVEDGLITAVGPDVEIPDGARTIDLSGLHLAPGLIDAAVTFDPEHDPLYLSAGVTLVRDSGSPTGSMLKERPEEMRNRQPGPALHVTSPIFASMMTDRPDVFALGPVVEAESQIDEVLGLIASDATRIQSFTFDGSILPKQHALVCNAAQEYGVEAWGPIPTRLDIRGAARNGQSILVGLDSLLPNEKRFETLTEDELKVFDGARAAVSESRWRVVPLLMGTARILRGAELDSEPEVVAALGPVYRTAWRFDLETFRIMGKSDQGLDGPRLALERQRELATSLRENGAQLVPGSGAPSGGIAPGEGLIDELGEWVVAGMTPTDALWSATAGAAGAVGEGGVRGRIAPGFIADMTCLGADPTVSIDALRSPELVVVRGIVRERFELDEAIEALERSQARADELRGAPIALDAPPMPPGELLVDDQVDLVSYETRTATERYQVVRTEDGALAYGARVRVIPTATAPERELVLVQIIDDGIVTRFDLALDALDVNGDPERDENGASAYYATGALVGDTKKLAVERRRFSQRIDSKRSEEVISLIEGSAALPPLIAAMSGREGIGYSLMFDPEFMEPVVDRYQIDFAEVDGRITIANSRGMRVYGIGPDGRFLFGASAEQGGRLDFEPAEGTFEIVRELRVPKERQFTGDVETWDQPTPAEAATARGGEGEGGK